MQVSELLALWKNVRTAQVAYRQALIDRRPGRLAAAFKAAAVRWQPK